MYYGHPLYVLKLAGDFDAGATGNLKADAVDNLIGDKRARC
jgi:hypothetical protein